VARETRQRLLTDIVGNALHRLMFVMRLQTGIAYLPHQRGWRTGAETFLSRSIPLECTSPSNRELIWLSSKQNGQIRWTT